MLLHIGVAQAPLCSKINELKEVLGHRKMETTYKYVHLDRTNLRTDMENGAL
jgi:site-specific recombinase XerD